ncbi:TonB-dependent receptor [Actimicrobium sp. CCI2.3]|uniref:TonB-dependent receptor n=1 Tax=Actimicrobium sp. CCI2.3 TaxID=3048616 RepID=UPI002AB3D72A|nr:TonB-dependent receptor [Actimicrobium sp. CCI2.3]MDY7574134.1 TonB-dependent receptor [Actimicrobium sp. CCI2.3]MEB0023264.1 TonB-dependent receptor [Actimicrobium sp. CCI2.3]
MSAYKFKLKKSALAVAATLVPCLILPAMAFGQVADNTSAKIERVEITGSSIKRIDAETALPVQIIKREDIERSGATSTEDLIRQISAFSSAGLVSSAAAAGSSTGSISAVSLRGLGSARTLVLINGRRTSVYGGGSGGLAGAAVDVNSIPLSAIERVEILKDGASAVYGSDAIAGVVNFILRKDFIGTEVTGSYGSPTAGGNGSEKKASIFGGIGNFSEQGFNLTYGATVQRVAPIFGADRSYASRINTDQGNDSLSSITFPANVLIPKTGALRNPNLANCGPVSQVSPYSLTRCSFDNSPYVSLQPGSEKINLLFNGRMALGTNAEAYFESGYSQNKTTTSVQPVPLNYSSNLPASNPYNAFFRNLIATQYPGLGTVPFAKTFGAQYPGAFLLPPSSPYYPQAFAAANGLSGQPLILNYRDDANGPRRQTDQSDASRFVTGVRGSFAGWDYDTGFLYSQSVVKEVLWSGFPQYSKILPLLDSGVINPFGPTADPAALAAARAAEFVGAVYRSKTSVMSVDAKASRELMTLPAGPLSVAVGAEFRKERFQYDPSLAVQNGDIAGQGGNQLPETAQRNVSSSYVELSVPLIKKLDADFAVRYDNYQNVGSTINPKVSLRWQPASNLLLRSAVGTGFRAPSLTDLYASQASSVTANGARDPLRCPVIATGLPSDCNNQFAVVTGGNPNLKPEKSLSFTFGILFEPVKDLTLELDAFRVNLENAIVGGGLSSAYILSSAARATQYAAYVQRAAADPSNVSGLGAITSIQQTNSNLFKTQLAGVDVDAKYALRLQEGKKVTLRLSGTFMQKYDSQGPDGSYTSALNQALTAGGGVILRWKHNASVTFEQGPWMANLAQNYQQSYNDIPSNRTSVSRTVDAYQTFDAQLAYSGLKSTRLTLGMKNLFDRNPPYANYAAGTGQFVGGYDISYSDVRGRFLYATATHTF